MTMAGTDALQQRIVALGLRTSSATTPQQLVRQLVAVLPAADVDRAMAMLTARHLWSVVLGTVDQSGDRTERVTLSGDHPRF